MLRLASQEQSCYLRQSTLWSRFKQWWGERKGYSKSEGGCLAQANPWL